MVMTALFLAAVFTAIAFPNFERAHWYRQVMNTVASPFQTGATVVGGEATGVWSHYISLVNASKENEELKKQLAEAHAQLVIYEQVKNENSHLTELLQMSKSIKVEGIGARVIANDVMSEFKTVTIDKGARDGIKKNMVVMGPGGLVGRIGQVTETTSRVFLISDPNSAVDVFVERSKARALLVGTSHSSEMRPFFSLSRLEYLRRQSDVKNGDVLITSGLDQLFPPNIPVGTVMGLELTESGIFNSADVVPFVDLTGVKEVLVVTK